MDDNQIKVGEGGSKELTAPLFGISLDDDPRKRRPKIATSDENRKKGHNFESDDRFKMYEIVDILDISEER